MAEKDESFEDKVKKARLDRDEKKRLDEILKKLNFPLKIYLMP